MTKKNWKMQSETVQFAGLSQFVNEAFDDLGDFWSAFSDEIDVSYGDAKHTLVSKLLVIDVLISMVNSEKNNANDLGYIYNLKKIAYLLIDAPDLIDLEN